MAFRSRPVEAARSAEQADEILVNAVLGELNPPPLPAGELEPHRAA